MVTFCQLSLVFVRIESKSLVFGLRLGDGQGCSFCRGVFREDYKDVCTHVTCRLFLGGGELILRKISP